MKKLQYIIVFILFLTGSGFAQGTDKGEIFTQVEQLPDFPGGTQALMKFIVANIKYPSVCLENYIGGKTFLKFVIDETGLIQNIEVLKSSGVEMLDEEAVRVVKMMPLWEPGKQNGKNVRVYFNLPIKFSLSDEKEGKKLMLILKNTGTSTVYSKAYQLVLNGETKAAKELLESAPNDNDCRCLLAMIMYNNGDKRAAKDLFIKTKESITDTNDIYYKTAVDYLKKYFGQQ